MVIPTAVARKVKGPGRPSPVDPPEGGWTWQAVAALPEGDYALTLEEYAGAEGDALAADAALPVAGTATAIDAIARATAVQGAAWERLASAWERAALAHLPDAPKDGPWQALVTALAPHAPALLAAVAPLIPGGGDKGGGK